MRRMRVIAALQKGHWGAWSGMLHTALAHAMHILQHHTSISGIARYPEAASLGCKSSGGGGDRDAHR